MKKKMKLPPPPPCPINGILLKVVRYIYSDIENSPVLSKVEDILYNDFIVADFDEIDFSVTQGYKKDTIIKFIHKLCHERVGKMLLWLFRERINNVFETTDRKSKSPIDDKFIHLVKELIWVDYYLNTKLTSRILLVGNPVETLSRTQGIFIDKDIDENKYNGEREEYLENIFSLKDARYGFLPHPDHIDPVDLKNILTENNLMSDTLLWLVNGLYKHQYTPYERYHVFKFVRGVVLEKLEEL